MTSEGPVAPEENQTRCPHERVWNCCLLDKPCHPGMSGCILSGQPLIDALLAYEIKEGLETDSS